MKKRLQIVIVVSCAMLLLSCAAKKNVVFTENLLENVKAFDIDIKDIQFYNSHKIVLERNISSEETKVSSGKIRFENGKFIERIIIKKNTPGICESHEQGIIGVSYEQGENRVLKFVRNARDNYQLSALEWKNGYGRVAYDTTHFFIAPGGEKTLLNVRKEDIFKFKRNERIAPGRSVKSN